MTDTREGSWLWRALRNAAQAERMVAQDPRSRELEAMREAYGRAEHEFEQAQALRASKQAGAAARANKAHRAGRKAFAEADAAWDAHKARTAPDAAAVAAADMAQARVRIAEGDFTREEPGQ